MKYIKGLTFAIFFSFAFLFFGVTGVLAADGDVLSIDLIDSDTDGDIDRIDIAVENASAHTWEINGTPFGNTLDITFDNDGTNGGGSAASLSAVTSVAISGSATANPVVVRVSLDENATNFEATTAGVASGDTPIIEVEYTPSTGDQTCTNCIKDGTDNEMATVTGDVGGANETDFAAPQISGLVYEDTDSDAKIDTVTIEFSEEVVANSVISQNDLVFTNVGDFTGAAFGFASTDLITTSVLSVQMPLGTESSAVDTEDGTAALAFSTQNLFSLEDANFNVNADLEAQAQAEILDEAAPMLISHSPSNGATDVAVDAEIVLTFSEPMNTGTYADTTTNDPTGGYTEVWSSGDTVLTLTHASDYSNNVTPSITIDTADAASGENVTFGGVVSGYANPFTFTTVAAASGGGSSFGAGEGYNIKGTISINEAAETTESQDVILNITATANSAQMVIGNDPDFAGKSWEVLKSTLNWTLEDGLGDKYVYIRFKDQNHLSPIYKAKITRVEKTVDDSNESTEDTSKEEVAEEQVENNEEVIEKPQEEEKKLPILPINILPGDLVKSDQDTSLYYIGSDSMRHGFINETVFYSYFKDFSQVKTITASELAQIPLGKNLKVRAGSWLVKIVSDPKVYAVEPGGVLRWITTEELAQSLYGDDWNKKVIDIDVSYFVDYQVGDPITKNIHPNGTLVDYSDGAAIYYVDQEKIWNVESLPILNVHVFRATESQAYKESGTVSFNTIREYSMNI